MQARGTHLFFQAPLVLFVGLVQHLPSTYIHTIPTSYFTHHTSHLTPPDTQIAEALDGSGLKVMTRSGSPAKPAEQHRAAAAAASTVVLLWPQELEPAAASAHTAAALSSLRASGGVRGQKVVVQNLGQAVSDFNAAQVGYNIMTVIIL